jgi:hypothetical protein
MLAALLSVTSCQKADLLPQPNHNGANASMASTDLVVTTPSIYRLTQQDQKTLTYDAKGKLIKSASDEEAWGITNGYHFIRRKRLDNIAVTDHYLDSKGRCIKSITTYPGIAGKLPDTIIYEYNTQGKLSESYCLAAPSATVSYAYNRMGDLSSITYHKADGSISARYSYFYQLNLSEPLLGNTYALNPDVNESLDQDLAIYGKFYNHFYRRMVEENAWNEPVLAMRYDRSFYYTLNSDGVPTKRTVKVKNPGYAGYNTYANNYTYQVTNLTISNPLP